MELYLGIDGGGTRSTLVLAGMNGEIAAECKGSGLNIHSIGVRNAQNNVTDALREILMKAQADKSDIKGLCMGAAGLGRENEKKTWGSIFYYLGFNCPIHLISDSEAALFGGLGKYEGLAVISGTGSICVGYGRNGAFARAGGWGHIIGDEGSGYYLGRLQRWAIHFFFLPCEK